MANNVVEILLKVLGTKAAADEVTQLGKALRELEGKTGFNKEETEKAEKEAQKAAETAAKAAASAVDYVVGGVTTAVGAATVIIGKFVFDLRAATDSMTLFAGSADKARDRIQDLVGVMGNSRRFGLEELEKGSRRLDILGGAALLSQSSLKLVGDAAVFAGVRFDSMADTVGKVYEGLSRGKSIEGVTQSLVDMGMITGAAKERLDLLAVTGMGASNAMEILRDTFSRSTGAMARDAESISGKLHELGMAFKQFGADAIEPTINWIHQLASGDEVKRAARELDAAIEAVGNVRRVRNRQELEAERERVAGLIDLKKQEVEALNNQERLRTLAERTPGREGALPLAQSGVDPERVAAARRELVALQAAMRALEVEGGKAADINARNEANQRALVRAKLKQEFLPDEVAAEIHRDRTVLDQELEAGNIDLLEYHTRRIELIERGAATELQKRLQENQKIEGEEKQAVANQAARVAMRQKTEQELLDLTNEIHQKQRKLDQDEVQAFKQHAEEMKREEEKATRARIDSNREVFAKAQDAIRDNKTEVGSVETDPMLGSVERLRRVNRLLEERAGIISETLDELHLERIAEMDRKEQEQIERRINAIEKEGLDIVRERVRLIREARLEKERVAFSSTQNALAESDTKSSTVESDPYMSREEKVRQMNTILDDRNRIVQKGLADQREALSLEPDPTERERIQRNINRLTQQEVDIKQKKYRLDSENTFGGRMQANLQRLEDQWSNVGANIADTITGTIDAALSRSGDTIMGLIEGTKTWADVGRETFRQLASGMISAVVTWIAQMTIVRALKAVFEDENKTQAAQRTAAEAPAAAMAATSSWGTAAIIGGVALAAILAMALAFEKGGLVGGGEQLVRVNEKGQEFVVNAEATRHWLPMLHQINAGMRPQSPMTASPSIVRAGVSGGHDRPINVKPSDVSIAVVHSPDNAMDALRSRKGKRAITELSTSNANRFRRV